MDPFERPSKEEWQNRQQWFETMNDMYCGMGSHIVSDQATFLLAEVEIAYCAGSWISVIVLAMSAIDSQIREVDFPDFKGNTKELLIYSKTNNKIDEYRLLRNSIVHINPNNPKYTLDELYSIKTQEKWKLKAEEIIELTFEIFYSNPGT